MMVFAPFEAHVLHENGLVFIIRPPFLYGYDPTFVVDEAYFSAALIVFGGSILQALLYILLRCL